MLNLKKKTMKLREIEIIYGTNGASLHGVEMEYKGQKSWTICPLEDLLTDEDSIKEMRLLNMSQIRSIVNDYKYDLAETGNKLLEEIIIKDWRD